MVIEVKQSKSFINPDNKKMLLSCDGGGIRGLIIARCLERIEELEGRPSFFEPKGDLIDGGVGSFNNPCYQATVEALHYLKKHYKEGNTRLLSFGTGKDVNALKPGEARRKTLFFWAPYVIGEGMDEAQDQQTWVVRHEYAAHNRIEFRRYQLAFHPFVMEQLGVSISTALLRKFKLDAVEYIEELDEIARAFASKIDFANTDGFELFEPKPVLNINTYQ